MNNMTALVQIMVLRRSGDKPLSDPMMTYLTNWRIHAPLGISKLNKLKQNYFINYLSLILYADVNQKHHPTQLVVHALVVYNLTMEEMLK